MGNQAIKWYLWQPIHDIYNTIKSLLKITKIKLRYQATLLLGTPFSTTLDYSTFLSEQELPGGHNELPVGLEVVSVQQICRRVLHTASDGISSCCRLT